ncbi:hypothetical protein QNO07_03415 [Streptomyces sp. 549]|uniref:hypothetical protein n=1 Tax=Streptomyces sp. 549 TaxID=3049076 RepID=UPI0024C3DFC9|nr:hypothetical protein [Streptomyces sp. 549]MDK1472482.1 hypothetical protein [Streptomyces sp. 549]
MNSKNSPTGFPVGCHAVDIRSSRVGRVMGHEGPFVQLRPTGGGREWDCPPEALRHASTSEELRVRVARLNRESRMP